MTPENEKLQVLVVDDERDIRDGCERILIRKGCEVSKATNGLEALEIIEKTPFAIVLLDLKMPGMDGMDVLIRVRERRPETLVIMITGYATIETAIEAMKRGAYDFIPKPFKPDQLRIVVDRAIEKKRLTDEAERLVQERRRTLKDLDMEKSRTRTIIQALPDGIMVSTPDAHVALMNPAFTRMLGLEPEAGKPGEHVGHYIGDEGFCNLIIDTSQGNVPSVGTGFCDLEREGGIFLRAHSTPVLGETGQCLGAVTVLSDITELVMLDRLKSEFVTKVSHELRSPLSTIQQQLAMVLNDFVGEAEDEQRHILSRAKEKTQGLITLIGDILDLSRMEAGLVRGNQPVDIQELLKSLVDFLDAKARGKKQTLTLTVPDTDLPLIVADPQALEIVFSNLITNAIHYTGDGGTIEVRAEPGNGELCVVFRDNGFGIEERHQEKIFEKFYRVKNDRTRYITGTGLGLPIVKGIVDTLGGRIELESEPGTGSTFRVFLPVPSDGAGS